MEITARRERQAVVFGWGIVAFGLPQMTSVAHRLVDYVFTRPGGVGVTVLALAEAANLDADAEEAREVERVLAESPVYFAVRNAVKCTAGFDAT